MKITETKHFQYSIKFKTPFKNSSDTFTERNGIIISTKTDNGLISFGEIAPLPGFSTETLSGIKRNITAILDLLIDKTFPQNPNELFETINAFNLSPSEQFGFEQALTSLLIQNDITSFLKELKRNLSGEINVNALIGFLPTEEILNKIQVFIEHGFTTIKIKAGRKNLKTI